MSSTHLKLKKVTVMSIFMPIIEDMEMLTAVFRYLEQSFQNYIVIMEVCIFNYARVKLYYCSVPGEKERVFIVNTMKSG